MRNIVYSVWFSGLRAALRQVAYLLGYHRKAQARFSGPRRLHCGIKHQDVGLERDPVDDLDDLDSLAAARR